MNVVAARPWSRPLAMVMFVVGLILVSLGLHGATHWLDKGTVVHDASAEVPGAPPWRMEVAVPDTTHTYLLECSVTLESPANRRETVTAEPELRVYGPTGERVDQVLEPAAPSETMSTPRETRVVRHYWLRPFEPGVHEVEVAELRTSAGSLKPLRWRLRLASDVPPAPGGRAPLAIGFAMAAAAFLLYGLAPKPRRPEAV